MEISLRDRKIYYWKKLLVMLFVEDIRSKWCQTNSPVVEFVHIGEGESEVPCDVNVEVEAGRAWVPSQTREEGSVIRWLTGQVCSCESWWI